VVRNWEFGSEVECGGVFRISVRRGRGAAGVEGWGLWRGWGPSPDKITFCLQNNKSPLYGSGTVFHSKSHLLRHFRYYALA